jgi:hypothetical protein
MSDSLGSGSGTPARQSRRERFFAGYLWFFLKNIIGWTLIVLSLVVGPLVPGPGGIPLFLVGFALISFPGKRRLTARVLRGRRVSLWSRPLPLVILGLALIAPGVALWIFGTRLQWLPRVYARGPLAVAGAYVVGVMAALAIALCAVGAANLILRFVPAVRRRARPWLRHHRIRLLPPRWRRRLPHEPGSGPHRLKDEILRWVKRPRRPDGTPPAG